MEIADWVIDCDTHITEPGDVWTDRLPQRFAPDAPHIERLDDGRDVWRSAHSTGSTPSGNALFETDYPHTVCLYGNVREKIDAGLADQPADLCDKLLWRNIADLYGVERPAYAWQPPA